MINVLKTLLIVFNMPCLRKRFKIDLKILHKL